MATVSPDVRRYVNAGRELRVAIYSSITSSTVITTLYFMNILDFSDPLLALMVVALILLPWLKILDTTANISSLRKRIEQELAFLIVAAASVSKTGLELADMLRYVSSSRVFKGVRALGERFVQLSNLFGSNQAMHMLSRIVSGKTRLLLTEYAASLSSGTALYLIRDRASDIVKTAAVDADRAVQSRIVIGLMLTIAFGIAPSLIVGMLMLQSIGIEGSIAEPGPETYAFTLAVIAILPLILVLTPNYPLSMRVATERKLSGLLSALTIAGTALLALPAIALFTSHNVNTFKDITFSCALSSSITGIPGFALILSTISTSRIDAIVEDMLNHVRVWRSLHLYRSYQLDREARRRVRPWLVDYLVEMLGFFRMIGDCDPGVFELLVIYVHECKRSLRKYVQTLAIMLAVVLISPVMNSSMLAFGIAIHPQHILLGYVSSIAYGFIASKVALGESKSTLLPAVSALIYALTLPA